MIAKYTAKIDVTKLDKTRFVTYERKDGTKAIEASVDIIIMDADKHAVVVKGDGTPVQGDGWRMEKVGFGVVTPSAEERTNNTDMPIVGNVTQFKDTESKTDGVDAPSTNDGVDEINPDDVPF